MIAEALDLYLREKKQLLGLGELERIEVVPEMNGQEQREDKRQEKKADQKAIPKPEPVVYAPEVEALNEEDLDAIAASLVPGIWKINEKWRVHGYEIIRRGKENGSTGSGG